MEDFREFLAARLAAKPEQEEVHTEADLLTAFAEARLGRGERKRVLAHLAVCAECREVVALASSARSVERAAPETGIRWWNVRWTAALAAACLVGLVVWRSNSVPPAVGKTAVVTGGATMEKPPQPPRSAPKVETPKPDKRPAVVARRKAQPQFTMQRAVPASLTPPAEKLTPPADLLAQLTEQKAALPNHSMAFSKTATPSALPQRALAFHNSRAKLAKAVTGLQSQSLWSIAADIGVLQKSADGGRTWVSITIDGRVSFLAISVSGSNIWAGGEGGALFHSTDDGSHWKGVPVVDGGTRLSESITAIETPGSQVKVRTKLGEWVSVDGGVSWRKMAE
jgi:hypothetical protein